MEDWMLSTRSLKCPKQIGGKDRCLNAMMAIHIMSPMAGDGILMRRQLSKSSGSIKRRNNTGQETSQRSAAGQM
ncbi:hypothetical protein EVE90_05060 [Lacticaseibacillus paracasei]|nr:hypothetical protein EVE90_05060 [Lacticaseibacillus paracasei]